MPLFVVTLLPARGRPFHREHFLFRSDELFGIAMTLEAPLHIQRRDLIGQRHKIDAAVTGRTADAFVHVNAVVEINEVRQVVHSSPPDWLACAPALANRLEIWAR